MPLKRALQRTTKRKLTAIDLFAGAGGFSHAARSCGVQVRIAVEYDEHAGNTFRQNFLRDGEPWPQLLEADLRQVSWSSLLAQAGLKGGECDLLLGGPPCQGFSTHRLNGSGVGDPRND